MGPANRPTDRVTYWVACTLLEMHKLPLFYAWKWSFWIILLINMSKSIKFTNLRNAFFFRAHSSRVIFPTESTQKLQWMIFYTRKERRRKNIWGNDVFWDNSRCVQKDLFYPQKMQNKKSAGKILFNQTSKSYNLNPKCFIDERVLTSSSINWKFFLKKNNAGYTAQDAPSTHLKITRDRQTYGPTDGRTHPLIEMRLRI